MKRLLAIALALVAGCAATPEPRVPPPVQGMPDAADIRMLAVIMSHMPGTFDSIAQDNPALPGVGTRMRIAPFWVGPEDKGDHWFYVEHSRIAEDPKPFRQRIYRFRVARNTFFMDVYALPGNPKDFVGEWRKPQPFAAYKPEQLHEFAGCRLQVGHMTMMFWARQDPPQKTCHLDNPGTAYDTIEMFASSIGMKEGEFGYDASGKQVHGASGVWDFRRFTTELR
jgi:hypothetical protein